MATGARDRCLYEGGRGIEAWCRPTPPDRARLIHDGDLDGEGSGRAPRQGTRAGRADTGEVPLIILRPGLEQVSAIQASQRRWYWSGAIDVVLRKRGWVPGMSESPLALITRDHPAPDTGRYAGFLAEGPLHSDFAASVAISGRDARSSKLTISLPASETAELAYNHPSVRPIRRTSQEEPPPPRPFDPGDPRWGRQDVAFQWLEPTGQWDPALFATDDNGTEGVIALRSDNALVLGVPLLDVAVQHHVMPPLDRPYWAMETWSDSGPLETWLLKQLEAIAASAGTHLISLDRWPAGHHAALTIRHDVDRPLSGKTADARQRRQLIRRLLSVYGRMGVKASWFWRVETLSRLTMAMVRIRGHEVALHTEAADEGGFLKELDLVRHGGGGRVAGYAAHGGKGSAGYIGLTQMEWAQRAGLAYGEAPGDCIYLPRQAIGLIDGVPAVLPLVLPGGHRSLDVGLRPEQHEAEALTLEGRKALDAGEHLVIMNHPDIHVDELLALLAALPLTGVWCATLREVASWFNAALRRATFRQHDGRMEILFGAALPEALRVELRGATQSVRDVSRRSTKTSFALT
jgi:hypothetical protein